MTLLAINFDSGFSQQETTWAIEILANGRIVQLKGKSLPFPRGVDLEPESLALLCKSISELDFLVVERSLGRFVVDDTQMVTIRFYRPNGTSQIAAPLDWWQGRSTYVESEQATSEAATIWRVIAHYLAPSSFASVP